MGGHRSGYLQTGCRRQAASIFLCLFLLFFFCAQVALADINNLMLWLRQAYYYSGKACYSTTLREARYYAQKARVAAGEALEEARHIHFDNTAVYLGDAYYYAKRAENAFTLRDAQYYAKMSMRNSEIARLSAEDGK